jgi:hypothetical protein
MILIVGLIVMIIIFSWMNFIGIVFINIAFIEIECW